MSEDKADYLTEAQELIGWKDAPTREVTTEVSGFVPLFDALLEKYDLITAAVFGIRWRFTQARDGVCKAKLETIAALLGIDRTTVMRKTEILVQDKYLIDLTPDLKNKPHIYLDGGLITIKNKFHVAHSNAQEGHVAQSNVTVAQSNVTVAQSHLSKVLNKDSSKENMGEIFEKANQTVDAILDGEKAKGAKYPNRDKLPDQYLAYADTYYDLTGQEPNKRVLMDWLGTFSDWQNEGIRVEHVRAAYEKSKGKFIVTRPGSLTNLAAALKAEGKIRSPQEYHDPMAPLRDYLKRKEQGYATD